MSPILYGIPNCDTVKRARAWLAEHGIDASFHDFKKAGVPPRHLDAWIQSAGWEKVLNRRGIAWRKLDDSVREGVVDAQTAKAVMLANPSVVKRPVVEWDAKTVTIGFDPDAWPPR